MNREIEETEWMKITNEADLNDLMNDWTEKYQGTIEKFTPSKQVKIEPWSKALYNRNVKKARRKRDD